MTARERTDDHVSQPGEALIIGSVWNFEVRNLIDSP